MGQPRKHVLTQALGVTTVGELRLGRNEGVLRHGEWLMLASDGVTNTLSPEEIASCLDDAASATAAAQSVMERTLESRPTDNATLILARWLGPEGDVADLPRVYPD
jgi:protein phosphatase